MLSNEEKEQRQAEKLEGDRIRAERKKELARLAEAIRQRKLDARASRTAKKEAESLAKTEAAAKKKSTDIEKWMEKFKDKMNLHAKWLDGKAIGEKAVFRNTKFPDGIDLSGYNFRQAHFTNVTIDNCNLEGAGFTSVKMNSCKMRNCSLVGCNLQFFSVKKTDFSGTDFGGAYMYCGDFDKCIVKAATFKGTKLHEMTFKQCHLRRDANLEGGLRLDPSCVFEYDEEE